MEMDPELEKAVRRAGRKLSGGLILLIAILGVRIVIATPAGVEGEIAELEEVAAQLEAEEVDSSRGVDLAAEPEKPEEESRSLLSRLGAQGEGANAGSKRDQRDAERLVSCGLSGGNHFMRAADCAARGGRSTDLD